MMLLERLAFLLHCAALAELEDAEELPSKIAGMPGRRARKLTLAA